jgi:hypothetical protein
VLCCGVGCGVLWFVCSETNDASACYHLARQYEGQDKIREAIQFYTAAKRYNHGIRLAREHGLEAELLRLALECGQSELKIDAAKYVLCVGCGWFGMGRDGMGWDGM